MMQNAYFKYIYFLFAFFILLSSAKASFGAYPEQIIHVKDIEIEAIKKKIQLSEAEIAWLNLNLNVIVRVGDWPPFMMAENEVSGIAIDYLAIIAKVHGIKFKYITQKDISWPNTLKAIRERSGVDIIPAIQPTAERRKYMDFSKPYQTLPWVIVTRSDSNFVGGLEDLKTKRISVQERFILQKQIEKKYPGFNLNIVKTSTPTLDSLKEVATGESYATINALPVVVYFIRHYGLSNLKVAAPAKFQDLELAMGIRNDWPELASIISKTIQAMSQKDVGAIQNAWLSVQYEQGFNPNKVIRWTLLGVALFVGIVVLFSTINQTLKRQVKQRTKALEAELEERKRIQQHLKNSEERYDLALRAVSDGLWDWDLKTNNVFFSPRYFEMLGYESNELPQTYETWTKLLHPEDKKRAEKILSVYLKKISENDQNAPFSMEFRMKAKDGEWKWILSRGKVPIRTQNGTPLRLIGTHIDITERKKTEKIMVQTEKMMSVGGLAAGMAHEINNPLAGILGAVQNIQNRIYKDIKKNISTAKECDTDIESIRKYFALRGITPMLENIQTAGFRASTIVQNMLQFSRKSNLNFEIHDLAILLDKTIELAASDYNLKNDYDFKKIEIKREYDSKVPKVCCINNDVQQVFLNILKNGAEAMAEKDYKGASPMFVLRIKNGKEEVIVELEDNGPGMTESTRKRVFDPFYTTKSVGKGTGLGLSVSYFIITEQHNGIMEVESTLGMNTRFTIKLPVEGSHCPRSKT
ncbi:PAS domain S-box-containing protein [Maridesulfovibrio ferrireducens]|uniref:histidine kinase n=1 Tax=Maridesulfovibrio ferrireducens TaxID=246191 RepID=A0A1G9IYK5_9BACT|nr:transporter substrate-binding domain-containing protein [Maridesulfovibrio ferrireducens]SDL30181.1 PAS domain S-box-containing protein [Maridesulfovibrio ferrireducens]